MGLIQEVIKKIRNKYSEEPDEELPDDATRDRYLRSLRREDRTLDEEEEKEYLKKKIAMRRKLKLRKELFGIKGRIEKQKREKQQTFYNRYQL